MGNVGQPWLLTTSAVEKVKIAFIKEARNEVAEMLTICPKLVGWVDASYSRALRLLESIGFDIDKPLPFGPKGVPFCQYRIQRPD